jgi:hypothetical protein
MNNKRKKKKNLQKKKKRKAKMPLLDIVKKTPSLYHHFLMVT